jgi:uncharacterized protein (TIGR02391 family)
MARPSFLDQSLLSKIAAKLGKSSIDVQPIRQMVARRASKLGISSEGALILLAKENGIGASNYLRKLDSSKQSEVRQAISAAYQAPATMGQSQVGSLPKTAGPRPLTDRESVKVAIEFLLEDDELKERCRDLLLANKNFDRAVNQATLVLEDRIRDKATPPTKLVGENLVNFAFKEDVAKTVLKVKSGDPDDQRGCTQILRGVVPYLRNKTHHHIVKDFSREDALRVCGFIDVLLRVVDDSVKI